MKAFYPTERPSKIPALSTWREIQQTLSSITGFPIGLYNRSLEPIVPPTHKNRLEELVFSTEKGRDLMKRFYKKALEKALSIDRPLLITSPLNQLLFIVPLETKEEPLFVIGGYTYLRYEDFSALFQNAETFGLTEDQIAPLAKEVILRDYKLVEAIANFIHTIINKLLKHSLSLDRKLLASQKQKALFGLLVSLITSTSYEEAARQIFQAFCILFDAEAMSIMVREGNWFVNEYTFGDRKDALEKGRIGADEPILERAIYDGRPQYIEDLLSILELGFGEGIDSIYVLPLLKEGKTTRLINIFNTKIGEEEKETLQTLSPFLSFLWEHFDLMKEFKNIKQELLILSEIHKAIGSVLEEESLYQAIIEKSTELTQAEQASIMVLDPESKELIVKAVKGVNKALIEHLRLKLGEGIAGKVCETSKPLVVDDVEEELKQKNRPRYRTKSFISLPLKIDSRTIGVLNITDKITGEVFSEDDLWILQSFASYASIAIERAEFFKISEDLRRISITDPLTGLLNRRYFQERLAEEMERARRHNYPLSLIMIDIDAFKLFNDTRGHLAGDEALKSISRAIRQALRTIDIVARYGGEEFAVILPQTDKRASATIAERIRKEVEETILPHKELPPGRLTVSLGIASFPEDTKDLIELVNLADKALYRAKATGKNRVCIYGDEGP